MDADIARAITKEAKKNLKVSKKKIPKDGYDDEVDTRQKAEKRIPVILERIEEAARKGKNEISFLIGFKSEKIWSVASMVTNLLAKKGFKARRAVACRPWDKNGKKVDVCVSIKW
jgi:hypothetical protein